MESVKNVRSRRGRPKGSNNRFSVAARQLAEETGALPHEVLLHICRGTAMVRDVVKIGDEFVDVERFPTVDERIRAASAAAPFFAPKFAAQTLFVQSSAENPIAELMEAIRGSTSNRARPDGAA
jgi:hypothetical protein